MKITTTVKIDTDGSVEETSTSLYRQLAKVIECSPKYTMLELLKGGRWTIPYDPKLKMGSWVDYSIFTDENDFCKTTVTMTSIEEIERRYFS